MKELHGEGYINLFLDNDQVLTAKLRWCEDCGDEVEVYNCSGKEHTSNRLFLKRTTTVQELAI